MRAGDTIVAVATPPGRGARAMVRTSGPGTCEVVRTMLRAGAFKGPGGGPVCFVAPLALPARLGALELPVLVSLYRGNRSYTGEDAAEIQLPANSTLVERV